MLTASPWKYLDMVNHTKHDWRNGWRNKKNDSWREKGSKRKNYCLVSLPLYDSIFESCTKQDIEGFILGFRDPLWHIFTIFQLVMDQKTNGSVERIIETLMDNENNR